MSTTGTSTPPSGTSTATTTQNSSSTATIPAIVVPDISVEAMTSNVYGIFAGIFMFVLTIFVLFSTGSILAVLVLWATIALILTVLVYYGIIVLESIVEPKQPPKEPVPVTPPRGGPLVGSEVFHISQNQFTYDESAAVCAAYGAQLATLEQIIDAYNNGAEWCGYGWSAGGMALYPTQKSTWQQLQNEVDSGKRTACGRPGVNGGYFDPSLKFGVNCYGFKPPGEFTPPAPLPGVDKQKFDSMVNKFREMLKSLQLSPFSRNEWSGYDSNPAQKLGSITENFVSRESGYGSRYKQDLGKLVEPFDSADPQTVEVMDEGSGYSSIRAPFGLRGDVGPPGSMGPVGPQGPGGPIGPQGPAGVGIQGQQGPAGSQGPTGDRGGLGPTGPKGDRGERGEQGEQGVPGTAGSTVGVVGPQGPTGPQGVEGPKGGDGKPGRDGERGPTGPRGLEGSKGPTGPVANIITLQDTVNILQNSLRNYVKKDEPIQIHGNSGRLDNFNLRCGQGDRDRDIGISCGGGHGGGWNQWRIRNI
jgi:hypothetical protein